MLKFALILLFTFQCAHAVDIGKEILRLNNEEFSVRAEATTELSKLPVEFVNSFLSRAEAYKETNQEVWSRLIQVAKNIFCDDLRSDERFLRIHGGFPFTVQSRWVNEFENKTIGKNYPTGKCSQAMVFRISFVNYLAIQAGFRINDVVLLVDGDETHKLIQEKNSEYGVIVSGRTYELTIMRFDKPADIIDFDQPYKIEKIYVKATYDSSRETNESGRDFLDKEWDEYLSKL